MEGILKKYKVEPKTTDDFIMQKVETLIEQSIIENKKRRKLENRENKKFPYDFKDEMGLLNSVNELSHFPTYTGRGIQEHAPDIKGSLTDDGFTSMTLWYHDVSQREVDDLSKKLISKRFTKRGNEYAKRTDDLEYYVMIEYSNNTSQLRLYHTVKKI